MARRKVLKPGSVYSFRLGDGEYAFGQACEGNDFAFSALKLTDPLLPVDMIVA